jgi:hypothetical protein
MPSRRGGACKHIPDKRPSNSELEDGTLLVEDEDAVQSPVKKPSTAHEPTAHRADIDGLRAVAVTAVIVYHIDRTWLPGGFVGVDIFFVISGFVVSASLLRQPSDSLCTFLLQFYARRVQRLAPSLLCTVFVCSVALSLIVPPTIAHDLGDYYVSAALGIIGFANSHFAARGTACTRPPSQCFSKHAPFSVAPRGSLTNVHRMWACLHAVSAALARVRCCARRVLGLLADSDEGPEALEYNPFTHLWSARRAAHARSTRSTRTHATPAPHTPHATRAHAVERADVRCPSCVPR